LTDGFFFVYQGVRITASFDLSIEFIILIFQKSKRSIYMKKLFFIAITATSLFACQSNTKSAFDLANAKKEIEAANVVLTSAISKGDSLGAAEAYTSDGKFMGSNLPSVTGKANLTSFWGGFIKAVGADITLTTSEVWGNEESIIEEGVFEIKSKQGDQLDKGKYIVLWKKEDGKWKLHRDISNSDLPLAPKGN
jgi:ketosteroid isomerase-like protein